MCIYLAIFLNSSLKASLNHPYKIGFENAEDMPIKWQKAKHIRLACSLWKRGKNSIPLSILIGHFSVENNHSTIFEYISGTYLVTYLPQRYCVYPIWYLRHLKGTKIVQTSQLWKQATHEFGIVFWVSLAADYFEFLMGHLLGFVQHPKIEIKNRCQIEFK